MGKLKLPNPIIISFWSLTQLATKLERYKGYHAVKLRVVVLAVQLLIY